MSKRFRVIETFLSLVIVLTFALMAPLAGQEKSQVVEGWGTSMDPDGDCKITLEAGKLKFVLPGVYHDFWPEKDKKGKVNAPRILQEVEGNFRIEVKVAGGIRPEKGTMIAGLLSGVAFQSGCLLIWQDDQNFMRFDFSGVSGSKGNKAFFYLQSFKNGKRAVDADSKKAVNIFKEGQIDTEGWLRLERRGNKVFPAFSQDGGKNWLELPSKSISCELGEKVKVGVGAVNNTTKPFTAELEGFRLSKLP